jgi:ABC-type sugar transport system ATPase subunit
VVDIARSFGETRALKACSLDLRPGEVLAIMGENGSGKSTLVKILSGVIRPDRGHLLVERARLDGIASPSAARMLGIATVFQEVMVAPNLTLLENLYLGADGLVRRTGQVSDRHREAAAVLARLLDSRVDLDAPAESQPLSVRQVCVIGRALLQGGSVLILDEATSSLDVGARQRLFEVIRERAAAGGSIIFISHRIDEVEEIADRVTVLRSGDTVATLDRSSATAATIVQLVSGDDRAVAQQRAARAAGVPAATGPAATAVRAREVILRDGGAAIDCQLRVGEIVGLAGLEGHGQDEFLQVLAGLRAPLSGVVERVVDEAVTPIVDREGARRAGVAYVPRERKTEGIFPTLSILDNFGMPSLRQDRRWGLVSPRRTRARFAAFVGELSIRAARPLDRITTLSGGNQQKVIMARWLATRPRVLLLNDPTRGVDHPTKLDLYERLAATAADGITVVMLSTEVDEHLLLMDRVLVFREGSVFAEFVRPSLDRRTLTASLFGRRLEGSAA